MSDRLVTVAWRVADRVVGRDLIGGAHVPWVLSADCGAYVWRHGRSDVTLKRDGESWSVTSTTIGRLLGPRIVLHSARHGRADLAVWDVMARVIKLTHDEDQGLTAGSEAARWIRTTGTFDEGDVYVLH
jgi:hypothetical protein